MCEIDRRSTKQSDAGKAETIAFVRVGTKSCVLLVQKVVYFFCESVSCRTLLVWIGNMCSNMSALAEAASRAAAVEHGDTFVRDVTVLRFVKCPTDAFASEHTVLTVQLPANTYGGDCFFLVFRDGSQSQLQAPDGARPGDFITIQRKQFQ